MPFRASLGYTDQDGILMCDNFNRMTGSFNICLLYTSPSPRD